MIHGTRMNSEQTCLVRAPVCACACTHRPEQAKRLLGGTDLGAAIEHVRGLNQSLYY